MRQVYRVAGADLDASSLHVGITLNRSERPLSGNAETYLQQLGLSVPSDATVFDRANRLFPRQQDPQASEVIHESYIIFPHLQPFADPTRLTPTEASDSLYRTPLFLLLSQGPPAKFAMRLQYNATGGGDRSTLNLNALQLRENSEQLFVGRPQAGAGGGLLDLLRRRSGDVPQPRCAVRQRLGAGDGALRGAGPLRRGARPTSSAWPRGIRSAIAAPST